MKRTKLINLSIIGTLFFFTACSQNEPKVKNSYKESKISIYNIMGISEETQEVIPSIIPVIKKKPYIEIPQQVEYISYKTNDFNREKTLNKIEWNAKSFLGTPYVWGATGPSKFDCSGFTQWVYRDVGINIPRVSRDQARVGKYIAYSNLQRGDMVFFDTKKHRSGKVTHVGIYLGQGNFIHASSAGKKVVIYNFNKKNFYKKRFLWGRRVTNDQSIYALK
jgi:cell wall-associated NlpC family hydrolase